MEIVVTGRNVEVSEELRSAAEHKLPRLERLASDIRRAEVELSEERNPSVADPAVCEITLHLTGNPVKAHAAAAEHLAALDLALDKAESQLHKVKDRRTDHSGSHRGTGG